MSGRVLILRPEPGASASAAKAASIGLAPVVAPLFTIHPVAWDPPPNWVYGAVILTSASAARLGGAALGELIDVPCYAVGETTAAAAAEAGFTDIHTGPSDGAALLALMADAGITEALHLCGRDHIELQHPLIRVERRVVYASDAADALPEQAREALGAGALALLHSPRAAALFAEYVEAAGLAKENISIAAISEAAVAAAGCGWKSKAAARGPRDDALLELAAELCQTGGETHGT